MNYGADYGTLAAGTHNYVITVTDKAGLSSNYNGSFNVDASSSSGPTISGVAVLTDSSLITWNALDSDGVASTSLKVDGVAASKIYGPYAANSGVNFSGTFGTLAAGSHSYEITATDKAGHISTLDGTFNMPSGSRSLAGSRSLSSNAVLGALAMNTSTSAKVDWLYDDTDSLLKGSTTQAMDAALASY